MATLPHLHQVYYTLWQQGSSLMDHRVEVQQQLLNAAQIVK